MDLQSPRRCRGSGSCSDTHSSKLPTFCQP